MASGRRLEEILDGKATEPCIEKMQLSIEQRLRASDVTFLDRAFPDSLTFRRLVGRNPHEILAECFHHRYASVFILDQLPFQLDGARVDDDVYKVLLDEWLVRDYSALEYSIVRVPVLPPQERLALVLEKVSAQEQK